MELIELSISVWANENRYTGKKVPHIAEITMNVHLDRGIFGSVLKPIINRKEAANNILREPSWNGLNPTNPRLINIKELPQIQAKMIRYNHFIFVGFIRIF